MAMCSTDVSEIFQSLYSRRSDSYIEMWVLVSTVMELWVP
jgi:hypothetical protein